MDSSKLITRYKSLSAKAANNKAALDRAKGVRDSLMKTAKEKVGVSTLTELKEALVKLQEQAETKYNKLDTTLSSLEKESDDLNINDLKDLGLGNV
jgi:hypothetical protein